MSRWNADAIEGLARFNGVTFTLLLASALPAYGIDLTTPEEGLKISREVEASPPVIAAGAMDKFGNTGANGFGPCCLGVGGCEMLTETDCAEQGGSFIGVNDALNPENTCANADDDDGVADVCDNCPNVSNPFQHDCDNDGEGDICEADPSDRDDDFDGVCNGVDPCPNDASKSIPGDGFHQAPGICGCGCTDPCEDCDSDEWCTCCTRPDNCGDQCPNDPNKINPAVCGCGVPDEGDEDGDGFLDCVDQCRGVDDAIFAPQCAAAIPALGEWGIVILTLLLLTAAKAASSAARRATRHSNSG